MTAPEPGLTDLIAAHWTWHEVDEDGDHIICACGTTYHNPQRWAEHLKFVVEQHTNGRHEWPKTTPTGHTYERPTTYVELVRMSGHMVQGEIECWEAAELPPEPVWEMVGIAQQEVERERSRAEKAEATIARVENLAAELKREGREVLSLRVRAALEGEQQ
ncbi:hypothetical protein ACSVIA_20380 [Rhodococcus erythropolis]|uniref:hypothetical protein n=1 Tax=Rhodococcus erythropolis TaxID=1833 RepID=UPI00404165FC